ncbi:MerR family transcriptional regulator [Castellaniella hirudinis]|uniref:MerR family transcriptional regulator n=1 Tax=Castellaniella hirudinis TaxID=1144617 RepID=A0ABV8RYT4_9BURK
MMGSTGALDRRMIEKCMKISELARQAGVGVETVRYYQRRGLLAVPEHQAGAYRDYPSDAVEVIRQIRCLRGLDFSLDEIGALLRGGVEGCPDVRAAIQRRIQTTQRDLDGLRRQVAQLRTALKTVPCQKSRLTCGLACLTACARPLACEVPPPA